MTSTFHVKINNGPEQVITQRSGIYWLAVAHALATLEYEESTGADEGAEVVKIWVPRLVPEYGPYFYVYDGHSIYSILPLPW